MDNLSLVKSILDKKNKIAESNSQISIWNYWYQGYVPTFHPYKIYQGNNTVDRCLLSMHMAKKVCEDWASLLMNEKVLIGVFSQDLLNKVLLDIDFYNKANKSVEYGFALSMAALVIDIEDLEIELEEGKVFGDVNVTQDTKVTLSIYSALKIVPITFRNGHVIECAFVQENTDTKKITLHTIDKETKTYNIIVFTLDKENGITSCYQINTKSKRPFFAIIHPQLVNNFDMDSQYPISIFANAIDTLKAIDIMFDSYTNEFNLGRKRIFVSGELDTVDKETGIVKKAFDPKDVVIHQLPPSVSSTGESKPLIYEANGQLRAAEHSQAIQDMLNFFSSQCELGVDYYRFEKGRVMTATQVISEKSDTFRNLKKQEGIFEVALNTIIKSLMYAYNEFTLNNEKFEDIETVEINFDDSIIEDKNTEKANDQKDVEFGAMSLVAYRMKWYAEDEETAIESMKKIYGDANFLKRLANFTPYLIQGVLTPLEFVKVVYIDVKGEAEQKALANEINQAIKSSNTVFGDGVDASNIYNPPTE